MFLNQAKITQKVKYNSDISLAPAKKLIMSVLCRTPQNRYKLNDMYHYSLRLKP